MPDHSDVLQVSLAHAGGTSVTMTVRNTSDAEASFCRYHTPFEGVRNNIFRVSRGRRELEYQGMMAKRVPPGPDDHQTLQPGESVEATVDLTPSWSLKRGAWTVQYRGTSISGLGDSDPMELEVS